MAADAVRSFVCPTTVITDTNHEGAVKQAVIDRRCTTVELKGPVFFRINKSATANLVEVSEFL